eukprot:TRINITY_DN54794_c0_g1_i2.p1 TRINITY_DN54794_c0_g1~~TRINITY_DN54794_c0_g1_i2.p1  ORF type:complete len:570 (+),score=161.91 TRINITY_DN54794_c0_g1_i2:135-1844(+)
MCIRDRYPDVTDEEFVELCMDEFGDHLPGLNADPFEDPFKDFISVLPPIGGGLPQSSWEQRVAGYLGYCLDGGILADYITMEGLLMVAAYKNYPEFWKHVLDPKAKALLKQTSEKVQILIKYFLHVRLVEADERSQTDWSQPWLPPLTDEDKANGLKKPAYEDMPPQLKPVLIQRDKQDELLEITYNVHVMTRLIQSGYLRWDFFPKIEPERQIEQEAIAKQLKKFVKIPKVKKQMAVDAADAEDGAPSEGKPSRIDRLLPKKAMPIEQWILSMENAVKQVFLEKNCRIEQGHHVIDRDDRDLVIPALLDILGKHDTYEAKDKLSAKDRQKFNTFTEGLMMSIRYITLCHRKCNSMRDYFQLLVFLMEDTEDVDLLCAISQEIASLAELVYQQRRAGNTGVRSVTVPFNAVMLLPFAQPIGGDDGRQITITTAVVQNYVLKSEDEYLTLCGLRCLINMAGLADDCKAQIMGDDGKQLLDFLMYRIRDYHNNESILAAFCILIRNLASSAFGRQLCSCNLELRKRLLRHCFYLSLIHISEPTRLLSISYAVFCLKKKKKNNTKNEHSHHK